MKNKFWKELKRELLKKLNYERGEGMNYFYTFSELEAYNILGKAGRLLGSNTTQNKESPTDAGNIILQLAEQIKTERINAILDYAVNK